jgi:hypothetical protein
MPAGHRSAIRVGRVDLRPAAVATLPFADAGDKAAAKAAVWALATAVG